MSKEPRDGSEREPLPAAIPSSVRYSDVRNKNPRRPEFYVDKFRTLEY